MWMNWYVQDILVRQQIADAERRAAHHQLVREARARRAPRGLTRLLARLRRRPTVPAPVLVPQMKGR